MQQNLSVLNSVPMCCPLVTDSIREEQRVLGPVIYIGLASVRNGNEERKCHFSSFAHNEQDGYTAFLSQQDKLLENAFSSSVQINETLCSTKTHYLDLA